MNRIFYSFLFFYFVFTNCGYAQDRIDSLKHLLSNSNEQDKFELFSLLADEFYNAGNNDSAACYYIKSAELSLEKVDTSYYYAIQGYGNAAYSFNENQKYNEAIKYRKLALKYSKLENNLIEIAACYSGLGIAYTKLGDYQKAVNYFELALETDLKADNKEYLSMDYNSLGKIYQVWGKNDHALEYFKKAYELDVLNNDEGKMAIRLNSIGMTYRNMQIYDSAVFYLNKALQIDTKLGNTYKAAVRMSNLGNCFIAMKEYKKAEDYYLEAIDVFEKVNNEYSLCIALSEYAELLLLDKRLELSKVNSERSLLLAHKIKSTLIARDNYERLSAIYAQKGDFKQAFEKFKVYKSLNDSLFNERSLQAISKLEVKYETEKIESENIRLKNEAEINALVLQRRNILAILVITIAILILILSLILYRQNRQKAKNNAVLREKNEQLNGLNATKDKFFRIISHDLKNPLSAFRNIASSLNNSIDTISKEEIKYFTTELSNSSMKLYELLINLLKWSQTQTGGIPCNIESVNLRTAVEEVVKLFDLNIKEKKHEIAIDIGNELNVFVDEKILRTILRNLLSNAIKFTPENGRILIGAENGKNYVQTYVVDNGIGIVEEDLVKLFKIEEEVKKIGNSEEKGTGLGLIICKEMLEICNGQISVTSKPGEGTTFKFTLPGAN